MIVFPFPAIATYDTVADKSESSMKLFEILDVSPAYLSLSLSCFLSFYLLRSFLLRVLLDLRRFSRRIAYGSNLQNARYIKQTA